MNDRIATQIADPDEVADRFDKVHSMCVRIEEELYTDLRQRAHEERVPMAVIIRRALRRYL